MDLRDMPLGKKRRYCSITCKNAYGNTHRPKGKPKAFWRCTHCKRPCLYQRKFCGPLCRHLARHALTPEQQTIIEQRFSSLPLDPTPANAPRLQALRSVQVESTEYEVVFDGRQSLSGYVGGSSLKSMGAVAIGNIQE
jgi:hypothetical protein